MAGNVSVESVQTSWAKYLTSISHKRERRRLPRPQVSVVTPDWEFSFGDTSLPFHAASIGKLATATLIMQLIEQDELTLESRVQDVLPAADTSGLFQNDSATVGQLLSHSSGISDYFAGPTDGTPNIEKQLLAEPERFWTPRDLLDFSRRHQRPVGLPGEKFFYSDSGYVLLGLMIEQLTQAPFHEALRTKIFERVGMTQSNLWLREAGPLAISPAFVGRTDVSDFQSVSCDWAGGGIVSTLADLRRLLLGLNNGSLVSQETRNIMRAPRNRFRRGLHYGFGTMQIRFSEFMPLLRGLEKPYGHIGVLGTHAFWYPESEATVILNFHGTTEIGASFRAHVRIAQDLKRLLQLGA